MAEVRWVLQDAEGAEMRTTQAFYSREDAEAWMGYEWSALLDEGGEFVLLMDGDESVYRMGLRET